MLGNEVDVYLVEHPEQVDAYLKFLSEGRKILKEIRPDLPVGVTTTFSNLFPNRDLIKRIHNRMDIVSMTYYPLGDKFHVQPVSNVLGDFDAMAAFAGDRKLDLQEVGYPAAERLGSSDEAQAAFIDAIFDGAAKHRDQLIGMFYFLYIDLNDKMVHDMTAYYGLADPDFVAYLSTIGLKKQDGTPRKAWAEFQKRALVFTAP